jgi:hypothetical protein
MYPRVPFLGKTIVFLCLALTLAATASHQYATIAHGATSPTVLGVWASGRNSNVFNDTTVGPGKIVTIDLNVTQPPIMNAFDINLIFDQNVLHYVRADIKTNTVFGGDGNILREQVYPSYLRIAGYSTVLRQIPSGVLVHLNFSITRVGVSPLGLYETQLSGGPTGGDPITHSTVDGYFTDSSQRGPVADFTVSPTLPLKGQEVTLNATGSYDPKSPGPPNKGIQTFDWFFGTNDGSGQAGADAVVKHVFGGALVPKAGLFWVSLKATDSAGNLGLKIVKVTVVPPVRHDLRIFSFSLSTSKVTPGQTVAARIIVDNIGDYSENFNVTLTLKQSLIQSWNNYTLPIGSKRLTFNSTITTANLSAGIYEVGANVIVKQDDDPSNNRVTSLLQVTVEQASILPFVVGIPLAVAAVAGGLFAVKRMRSRPSEKLSD